jgi:hypothetical protein
VFSRKFSVYCDPGDAKRSTGRWSRPSWRSSGSVQSSVSRSTSRWRSSVSSPVAFKLGSLAP